MSFSIHSGHSMVKFS